LRKEFGTTVIYVPEEFGRSFQKFTSLEQMENFFVIPINVTYISDIATLFGKSFQADVGNLQQEIFTVILRCYPMRTRGAFGNQWTE
jgi:hypothetical protein